MAKLPKTRRKAGRGRWDAVTRGAFLAELARGATHAAALRVVGMSDSGFRSLLRADPAFAGRRQAALDRAAADATLARQAKVAAGVKTSEIAGRQHGGLKRVAGTERSFSVLRQQEFFQTLGETANVRMAALAAGVSKETAYKWRQRNPAFRMQWIATLDEAMIDLHMEMIESARAALAGHKGTLPPGSERLALGLLARHRSGTAAAVAEVGAPDYAERKAAAAKARAKLMTLIGEARARMAGNSITPSG